MDDTGACGDVGVVFVIEMIMKEVFYLTTHSTHLVTVIWCRRDDYDDDDTGSAAGDDNAADDDKFIVFSCTMDTMCMLLLF